jgi:hypothetical protein
MAARHTCWLQAPTPHPHHHSCLRAPWPAGPPAAAVSPATLCCARCSRVLLCGELHAVERVPGHGHGGAGGRTPQRHQWRAREHGRQPPMRPPPLPPPPPHRTHPRQRLLPPAPLQLRYQRRRMYTRIALGKNSALDVVSGEASGATGQLLVLYPMLFGGWHPCCWGGGAGGLAAPGASWPPCIHPACPPASRLPACRPAAPAGLPMRPPPTPCTLSPPIARSPGRCALQPCRPGSSPWGCRSPCAPGQP